MPEIAEMKLSYYPNNLKASECYYIESSQQVNEIAHDEMYEQGDIALRESFYALYLNRRNRVLGFREISQGALAGTVVDVRHVLAPSILANANGLIVVHNHPSGNITPSHADDKLTSKLKEACDIIEIKLLDHVVVSPDKIVYYSYADEGKL